MAPTVIERVKSWAGLVLTAGALLCGVWLVLRPWVDTAYCRADRCERAEARAIAIDDNATSAIGGVSERLRAHEREDAAKWAELTATLAEMRADLKWLRRERGR